MCVFLTYFPQPKIEFHGKKKARVANLYKNVRCVRVGVRVRALITPSSPTSRADISEVRVIIVSTQPPKHPVNLNQKRTHTYTCMQTHTTKRKTIVL